ncbi:DUF4917 family protein [Pseudomonas silensiensis]|uniref:DUF4917 family protein n=1 Tax=Pseudomonas silensiensis TaxID=2991049 RepID=UPI003D1B58B2
MISFQEALDSMSQEETPSLLLANGFSQAWNANIFNYANLLEAASFGERDKVIRSLFSGLNTYDFEKVMRQLVAAEMVCQAYGVGQQTIDQIKEDQERLKQSLITAISFTHPHVPHEVTDEQYTSVRKFISGFKQIFTVNYDLLLYWSRNKNDLPPANYRTDDGFRAQQRWEGRSTNQEVHFLHGGLHIYDAGSSIKKHAFTDAGESIIEQVRANLEQGKFPLFVSEPSHEGKLSRIEHNPYLNYCFQELRNLKGALFIFGHSMDENDKHIFSQIKKSDISKVFVSIYGDQNSEANTIARANARAYLERPGLEVIFFNAATAAVWA